MSARVYVSDQELTVTAELAGDGVTILESGRRFFVRPQADGWSVSGAGTAWRAAAAADRDVVWVGIDGHVFECRVTSAPRRGAAAIEDALMAPMSATVVRLPVAAGQHVAQGDLLVALEAMKMELPIRAPGAGVVRAVHCGVGDLVQPGRPLVDVDWDPS
jgi:biotin carboxyl carrier protein